MEFQKVYLGALETLFLGLETTFCVLEANLFRGSKNQFIGFQKPVFLVSKQLFCVQKQVYWVQKPVYFVRKLFYLVVGEFESLCLKSLQSFQDRNRTFKNDIWRTVNSILRSKNIICMMYIYFFQMPGRVQQFIFYGTKILHGKLKAT